MNVEERIERFQSALASQDFHASRLVQKFITFGDPYIIDTDKYFSLKVEISEEFSVHPSEIVMVGSGKLGFSMKPENEFRPFIEEPPEDQDPSDIDISIVSSSLFDKLWQDLYYFSINTTDPWHNKGSFRKYLFKGWIRPDLLPSSPGFLFSRDWWEFFNGLQNRLNTFKINAGIYRTWQFFEIYQTNGVNNCKRHLSLNEGVSNE